MDIHSISSSIVSWGGKQLDKIKQKGNLSIPSILDRFKSGEATASHSLDGEHQIIGQDKISGSSKLTSFISKIIDLAKNLCQVRNYLPPIGCPLWKIKILWELLWLPC
jgi:hypothetical protein